MKILHEINKKILECSVAYLGLLISQFFILHGTQHHYTSLVFLGTIAMEFGIAIYFIGWIAQIAFESIKHQRA